MNADLAALAGNVLAVCRTRLVKLAVAESCTGGLIAAYLTEIPGSSDVFDRGYVTYSNAAKIEMLGVDAQMIADAGAVSEKVAEAMAEGAWRHSQADVVAAVTGIAGPGGGTAAKPVGLVYITCLAKPKSQGAMLNAGSTTLKRNFGDVGRARVREQSVEAALNLVLSALREPFAR
jgi:nicotinamide-nucleotide amidase